MNDSDMKYIPHSAVKLRDIDLYNRHRQLIAWKRPKDAADLIKETKESGAFTASLFNSLEQKIIYVETLLEKMESIPRTMISDIEPTDEEMNGKFFWEQEYGQEE